MNKLVLPIMIVSLVAGLLVAPARSAYAASCDVFWDFEDGQAGIFAGSGVSVVNGQLISPGSPVSLAEVQGLYGISDPIPADNVSIGFLFVPGSSTHVNIQFRYTDGSFENTSDGTPSNNSGKLLNGFTVVATDGAFEDINLYMPCANVPSYKPPTDDELVSPLATDGLPPLPQPKEIPDVDPSLSIDLSALWDVAVLNEFVSIILTLFLLLKKHLLIQAVVIVSLISLSFLFVSRMVRGRQESI